jgi:hypothetical protein
MGRPKGSKNIRSFNAMELAKQMDVCPLEFMLKMVQGDHKYFGFKEANKISYTNAGIEFEEPNLKMADRVQCAKEAARYLYSTMQAVSVSSGDDKPWNVNLRQYISKKE